MSEAAVEAEPGDEGPVTVSIARRVRPGQEAAYEQWVRDIVVAVQVVLLTYLVMPWVTRLLKGWLYG